MATVAPTGTSRAINATLGRVLVEVALQRGPFWENLVHWREHWGVEPVLGLPPGRLGEIDERALEIAVVIGWPTGIIPEEADFVGPVGLDGHPWDWVFAALLTTTVPRDRLAEAREQLRSLLFDFEDFRTPGGRVLEPPAELPIRWIRDPSAVELWWSRYDQHFRRELLRKLTPILGTETYQFIGDAARAALAKLEGDSRRSGPASPFFGPLPTSRQDVLEAFDWLEHNGWPGCEHPAPHTKPKRDVLVCVQCAIWKNDYGLTYADIGEHMGWPVVREPHGSRRCNRAEGHVKEGRRIIAGA